MHESANVCICSWAINIIIYFRTGEKVPLHCVDRHPTQPHLVAAGSQAGVLNVWDMRREKFPVTLFDGHQGHSKCIIDQLA